MLELIRCLPRLLRFNTQRYLNDADITVLAENCPQLTELNIASSRISEIGTSAFERMTNSLQELDISYCESLSEASFSSIGRCTRLRVLALNFLPSTFQLSTALRNLQGCRTLEVLSLAFTTVQAQTLKSLRHSFLCFQNLM